MYDGITENPPQSLSILSFELFGGQQASCVRLVLHMASSRRVSISPTSENLQTIMTEKIETPPYDDLINHPRAKDKDEIRCVMCGLPPGVLCIIPRQNKDVCKDCDKSTWIHCSSNTYFKWCKGCKKFLSLGSFSEKIDAAKCDRCRERGRHSYLLKKNKDGSVVCCKFGRSHFNLVESDNDTDSMSLAAEAIASISSRLSPQFSGNCGRDDRFSDTEESFHRSGSITSTDEEDAVNAAAESLLSCAYPSTPGLQQVISLTKPCSRSVLGEGEILEGKRSSFGASHYDLRQVTPFSVLNDRGADVSHRDDHDVDETSRPDRNMVGTSLCGTLQELANVHERIVSLEEHAARVKRLEGTIASQKKTISRLQMESVRLKMELSRVQNSSLAHSVSGDTYDSCSQNGCEQDKAAKPLAVAHVASFTEGCSKRPRFVSMGD